MANVYSIFSKLTKQEVIGVLKAAGSRDEDVLFVAKEGLLKVAQQTRFNGTIFLICGIGFTVTILMSPIGISNLVRELRWRALASTQQRNSQNEIDDSHKFTAA